MRGLQMRLKTVLVWEASRIGGVVALACALGGCGSADGGALGSAGSVSASSAGTVTAPAGLAPSATAAPQSGAGGQGAQSTGAATGMESGVAEPSQTELPQAGQGHMGQDVGSVPKGGCSASPGRPADVFCEGPSGFEEMPSGDTSPPGADALGMAGSVDAPAAEGDSSDADGRGDNDPDVCAVQAIPDTLRAEHGLDPVYTRYASARGVPVLASDASQDEALRRACLLVRDLSAAPKVLETMSQEKIGLVVMGEDETSADFPEFARFRVPDSRARGLGGVPRGLCAEENIMCNRQRDRWRGESICVHEFAHTMHLGVYNVMERDFNSRVEAAFQAARDAGKYDDTYAASNAAEYFGEGVQDWYNTNLESARPNGIHNHINTRSELQEYDPALYEILSEVLPDQPSYQDCYYYE